MRCTVLLLKKSMRSFVLTSLCDTKRRVFKTQLTRTCRKCHTLPRDEDNFCAKVFHFKNRSASFISTGRLAKYFAGKAYQAATPC